MTNMHSRQKPIELGYDENILCYDNLILKLEEVNVETDEVLTSCYVAYDHNESEYYVCGKRGGVKDTLSEYFKFYCKKKRHMVEFLNYVLGDSSLCEPKSRINHILYNYKNLDLNGDEEHNKDFIDYYVFEEQEDANSELSGYNRVRFDKKWLLPLLKMLKNLRY
jgi:hypothetical protein